MAWDNSIRRYIKTRWPSPYDGSILGEGEAFVAYNEVVFDILRPSKKKKDNVDFYESYGYQSPSSLVQDTYFTTLKAKKDSVSLFLNDQLLSLNVHYTYSYVNQRFRLIHIVPDIEDGTIGTLYAKYVPSDDVAYLYAEAGSSQLVKTGLSFKRQPTAYSFEIVSRMREGIESLWRFMKKPEPLWVGGPENQTTGSDSLIKYVTPISLTHFQELGEELIALNDYINLRFTLAIDIEFVVPSDPSELLLEETLKAMMTTLNSLEDVIDSVAQGSNFDTFLDKS